MYTEPSPRAPTPAAAGDPLGDRIGPRLRAERERRGMTLRELAGRLSISASALSQIETGRSRPSVATLYAVVSELGLSVDSLLGLGNNADRDGETRIRQLAPDRAHVVRRRVRRAIELETGVVWERLNPLADGDIEFVEITYPPGASSTAGGVFVRHPGREYGVVRSGRLRVVVAYDDFVLDPGDAICFNSHDPHRFEAVGDEPAVAIWFVIGRGADDWASHEP